MKFEYMSCMVQEERVTWMNGNWQGTLPLQGLEANPTAALTSCPTTWEFLNRIGQDGWELCAVVPVVAEFSAVADIQTATLFRTMYVKRQAE